MSVFLHDFLYYFYIPLNILLFFGLLYIASVRGKPERHGLDFTTSTLVILPCRGIDTGMEKNLSSLKSQKHGNFRLLAVVDSVDDPAVRLLEDASVDYIISTPGNGSGKVNAIASAIENDAFKHHITVIADSDIRVDENWLASIIAPLSDPETGISTTFPFFLPLKGFWPRIKMVWGYVGLGMMQSKITRFGWGGSLAFRSGLLSGRNLEYFREYVSDDIAITKLCRKEGLRIAYVPEASPNIESPDRFHTFIEWANRQTALSIYATRKVLWYGLLFYGATIFQFTSAIILSAVFWPFYPVLLMFLPSFINAARSSARSGDYWKSGFLIQFIIPFIYFYNLVVGGKMKHIVWRGRLYSLENSSDP